MAYGEYPGGDLFDNLRVLYRRALYAVEFAVMEFFPNGHYEIWNRGYNALDVLRAFVSEQRQAMQTWADDLKAQVAEFFGREESGRGYEPGSLSRSCSNAPRNRSLASTPSPTAISTAAEFTFESHGQTSAKMSRASQFFSSLVELAADAGLIGQILRRYPTEILRAADKWAAQNSDCAEKHRDPNRLPSPDPWQFLLNAPVVPKQDKSVFRAAQSQLPALRHLIHMAAGIATLNTDWYQKSIEARARGDDAEFNRAISKVADGHVIHARVQEHVRKQNDPELLMQMERHWKKRQAQLVHRGKGNEVRQPKQWPSWREFRKRNALVVVLVEWWVRCGTNGAPRTDVLAQ